MSPTIHCVLHLNKTEWLYSHTIKVHRGKGLGTEDAWSIELKVVTE